ncbi:MAG: hypothetical protein PHD51_01135 [Patescibacteria group bacterium]|nr:hypothetical protein [Patescibacteria group bacterium]MDD5490534.1 hypothetical protein [Patescibacteria group bacterium]
MKENTTTKPQFYIKEKGEFKSTELTHNDRIRVFTYRSEEIHLFRGKKRIYIKINPQNKKPKKCIIKTRMRFYSVNEEDMVPLIMACMSLLLPVGLALETNPKCEKEIIIKKTNS